MCDSSRKIWVVLVVIALGLVAWTAPVGVMDAPSLGTPNFAGMSCGSLTGVTIPDSPMTITVAQVVATGGYQQNPVEMCRIAGELQPTSISHIKFEVWMPTTGWNGKFNGVGNGGLAGSISFSAMRAPLALGYATASTDTGHLNTDDPATWAIGHPYPPEKLVDFASRSIHLTAVAAKAFINAYYGNPAQYSYFTGCSGGGGQALSEAQRYPQDYNGIVAGAPANFPTHMWPGELYAAWVNRSDPAGNANSYIITQDKVSIINAAAVAACDGIDGLKDGLIDDPRRCNFNPATIVCKAGQDPNTCTTAAQADVVKKVYAGLNDPTTGAQFWPGYEPGSESQWWGHIGNPFSIPKTYFQYMVWDNTNYPGYPGAPGCSQANCWPWNTFNFSQQSNFNQVLYPASADLGRTLDSKNTDLSAFQARGGKLILWHGWNDQNIAPRNTIAYYRTLAGANWGQAKKGLESYARLFMVPGMQHCSGGPGPSNFDTLAVLDQWVANGNAPDKIIASHTKGASDPAFWPQFSYTRPLCPYPEVARWTGVGDWKDTANWTCGSMGLGVSAEQNDPANLLYGLKR